MLQKDGIMIKVNIIINNLYNRDLDGSKETLNIKLKNHLIDFWMDK